MPRSKRSRNFCFTSFNLIDLNEIFESQKDIIRYLCVGTETAPKTKKKHYQGWIQLINPKTIKTVQKILRMGKIHMEIMCGNEFSNDIYCQKDNIFKSWGKFKTQGQRSDLESCKNMLDNGATMKDLADSHFQLYCQYGNRLEKYKNILSEQNATRFRKLEVILITGPTGVGKTRQAMEHTTYKICGSSLEWWDGYNNDNSILIDEYANDIKITTLLNILDGYKLRLPIKGGFTYANWNKVYITTNLKLNEIHANAKPAHLMALKRRITKVINLWPKCHEVPQEGNTLPLEVKVMPEFFNQMHVPNHEIVICHGLKKKKKEESL